MGIDRVASHTSATIDSLYSNRECKNWLQRQKCILLPPGFNGFVRLLERIIVFKSRILRTNFHVGYCLSFFSILINNFVYFLEDDGDPALGHVSAVMFFSVQTEKVIIYFHIRHCISFFIYVCFLQVNVSRCVRSHLSYNYLFVLKPEWWMLTWMFFVSYTCL